VGSVSEIRVIEAVSKSISVRNEQYSHDTRYETSIP
jgi:hypothetical protein